MHRNLPSIWLGISFTMLLWPALKNWNRAQVVCLLASVALAVALCGTVFSGNFLAVPHCCVFFTLIGWVVVRKFGAFDPSFAARKFFMYHLVANILFLCFARWMPQSRSGTALLLIALCIFSSSFPFHGWIEHFFSHAPACLVAVFLLFLRPFVWFFTLQFLSVIISIENFDAFRKIFTALGALGCLFVPILFFSKKENRKLLGYMLCWQNGILWLLLSCCKLYSYIFLFELSVIQGILLTLLFFSFVEMQKQRRSDEIICFGSIYRLKKLWGFTVCSAFSLLGTWPLLMCWSIRVPYLCSMGSAASCLLYFCFTYRAFLRESVGL
ncbi:MAG: hypothetical protein LBD33_02065 [Puniceicoccales bacterium]|jgi:formate hydrogenlyase subunit 3/multisubunit Na+/H+ antiporter MnhD subunit|nr:hypothetical protein [Puniceicoccales bacterium]